MQPTFNNVFLREIKRETTTASGIILTQDPNTGNRPALVVAVGPEVTSVAPGDTAYVNWKENSMPVTVDGEMGVLTSETSIMGVVR